MKADTHPPIPLQLPWESFMKSFPGVIMKCPGLHSSSLSCKKKEKTKTHLLDKSENEKPSLPSQVW